MLVNYLIIAGIAIGAIYIIWNYFRKLNLNDDLDLADEDTGEIDIKMLADATAHEFSKMLKINVNDDHLTRDEIEQKRKRIATIRENLNRAAYGDTNAKILIKRYIRDFLVREGTGYTITEWNINDIIPFSRPQNLTANDRFRTVLYAYNKKYGIKGFGKMISEWNLMDTDAHNAEGVPYHIVTEEQIRLIYECLFTENPERRIGMPRTSLGKITLDFNDKLEILAQSIFEQNIGLGIIDALYDSTVDEIDGGVSGIPKGSFTPRNKAENTSYSFESIWVTYHGTNIHMKCISFETQQELVRVCDNIYKFDAPYVMSRRQGYVVSTMVDGSRIVVVRPPFADSYSFFLRKFDSTPSVKPEALVRDRNAIIPILVMKWMIKGQRNIAITGSQGTGKTTWLKSIVRYISTEFNIRVQELQAELNLRYTYPGRNIVAFQETASISAQDGLNLQKKTNGAVNIVGEVASAIQASHIIQTAMVASLYALFTHHAKTAAHLVEAISNNLLEMGLYKDKKDAVAMAAQVLNVDCHLTNIKGKRYIERITEIIPSSNIPYPSEEASFEELKDFEKVTKKAAKMQEEDIKEANKIGMDPQEYLRMKNINSMKAFADMPEYFHRVTDPKLYTTHDIVKWFPELNKDGSAVYDENGVQKGYFKLVDYPSDIMMEEIKSKLSIDDERKFDSEMEMLKKISDGAAGEEVDAWVKQALAQIA